MDNVESTDFEFRVVNPDAWDPEVVDAAGIGPAHPNHPYHAVYYAADGQRLSEVNEVEFVHRFRDAQVLFAHLGFPEFELPGRRVE